MIISIFSLIAYFFLEKRKLVSYFLFLVINIVLYVKTKEFIFIIQSMFCIYYLYKNLRNESKD